MGLIGSFLGTDQAKDLANAKKKSDAQIKQGYDQAYGDYTEAGNAFAPYAQGGQQGQQTYDALLGLQGQEARDKAQGLYASDPYEQNALGQALKDTARYGNAQGYGAGKEALAGTRVANEKYGGWRDLFNQRGQQGLQATNAMSQYRAGRGDLSYGYGATQAGNSINYGNAQAANRSTGINNLMGVASLGVSGLNAFNQPKLK